MARRFTDGFEVANDTAGHTWAVAGVSGAGRSTTSPRSGTGCGSVTGLVSATEAGWAVQFESVAGDGPYYLRFYLEVVTPPSADNCIAAFIAGANVTSVSLNDCQLWLSSTGALKLFCENTQVGSTSSALSAGYHMIELAVDNSPVAGSKVARAYIDGVEFAGSSGLTSVGGTVSGIALGGNLLAETQTTGSWRLDDVAVNDSTGSVQNGRPGEGKVIVLRPNAAGDSNSWLDTSAAAGTTNNYTLVDETNPNDATDMVQSVTLNATDLYNLGASGIGASDTVNVVHVHLRRRNNVADATTAVAAVVRKTSGGTDGVGTSVAPNTTTWRTGLTTSAQIVSPSYTAYTDPDGAAWTQATLDTMQAGCRITAAGTNRVQVSTVWVTVDYAEANEQIVAVGQATETDSAQAVGKAKTRAVGQASGTNAAQAVAKLKTRTVGQASATDTANATGKAKAGAVGIAAETDAARAVVREQIIAVGQASATDSALAVGKTKAGTLGQATETDAGQAAGRAKARALGMGAETDAGRAVAVVKPTLVGQAGETETANSLTGAKLRAVGLASTADSSRPLTGAKAGALGRGTETEQALTPTVTRSAALGVATETDAARASGKAKAGALGRAEETDEGQVASPAAAGIVNRASSVESARPVAAVKRADLGRGLETDEGFGVSGAKRYTLAVASETSAARAVAGAKSQLLGQGSETGQARPLTYIPIRIVQRATETDVARPITASGGAPQVTAIPAAQVRQPRPTRVAVGGPTTVRRGASTRVTL